MSSNPLLAILAPALTQVLDQLKVAAAAVATTPTLEMANAQLAQLEAEALNPTNLTGVSIGAAAQEVVNLISALEAHLQAATAAPSAAQTALATPVS